MSKKFSIKVEGKEFESDDEGMFDLNIIWRDFNLPNKNRPSEWRNKIASGLRQSGNLRTARKSTTYNEHSTLIADERATVAYAMWISLEFYMSVIDAFIALRNGEFEKAVEIAGETLSEDDNYYLQKLAAMKGLCFQKSCWYANITEPNKVMNYLLRRSDWKYFSKNSFGKLYATEEGVNEGLFYNCYGTSDSSKVVMRVTKKGREKLREHAWWFNSKVIR